MPDPSFLALTRDLELIDKFPKKTHLSIALLLQILIFSPKTQSLQKNDIDQKARKNGFLNNKPHNQKRRLTRRPIGKIVEAVAQLGFSLFVDFFRIFSVISFSVLALIFTILAIFVWPYLAIAAGACVGAIIAVLIRTKKS